MLCMYVGGLKPYRDMERLQNNSMKQIMKKKKKNIHRMKSIQRMRRKALEGRVNRFKGDIRQLLILQFMHFQLQLSRGYLSLYLDRPLSVSCKIK